MWQKFFLAVLILSITPALLTDATYAVANAEGKVSSAKATNAAIRVSIPSNVVVSGSEVYLLDLVDNENLTDALKEKWRGVSIGQSPRSGGQIVWNKGTLLTRLKSKVPQSDKIEWNIPPSVIIKRPAGFIDMQLLTERLEAYAKQNQAILFERIRVDNVFIPANKAVPDGELEYEFEANPNEDFLGQVQLVLIIRSLSSETVRIPIRAKIEGEAKVIVTTKGIRKDQIISNSDVKEELRWLSSMGQQVQPAMTFAEVVGKASKKAISGNQLIDLGSIEMPPVVKRGDAVTIIVKTPNLIVTCAGEARDDGRAGETIPVFNSMAKKEIKGKLQSNGDVVIDYRSTRSILSSMK